MWAIFINTTKVSPSFSSQEEALKYAVSMFDFDLKKKIKIEIGEEVFFVNSHDLKVKLIDG